MFTWLKSGGDGFKLINWKRKKKKERKKRSIQAFAFVRVQHLTSISQLAVQCMNTIKELFPPIFLSTL